MTALAEVIVNAGLHLCHEDLRHVYGTPCLEFGETSQVCVAALGKCGGGEIGFASDIELMFLYAGNGKTTGPNHFDDRVLRETGGVVPHVDRAQREGIFEVDLQLRP